MKQAAKGAGGALALAAQLDAIESNVRLYSRTFPAVFERARGAEVFDVEGRRYLDFFCGAGALNYGHNDPRIKERLLEHLAGDGIVHALDAHTVTKAAFAARLVDVVLEPRGLDYKLQFCGPTGANAVEAALKLARKATGRTGVVAFSGSYHGLSLGALSVSGGRGARAAAGVPLAHTTFVPFEVGPAGPFDSIAYLERLLDDPSSGVDAPAAAIVETVQLEGGVYVASPDWLRALRKLTERRGIVLVCDDVQAGCGRTGSFFSFERADVVPDVVVLSKSIGGYGLPLSLCLLRPGLDCWSPGEHTGTFRGNELALVAAEAALAYWAEPSFLDALAERGRQLAAWGRMVAAREPGLEARGIGMVLALDLARAGVAERARRAQRLAFERGLLVELCGRDDTAMKVMPPLCVDAVALEEGCSILAGALAEA